MSEKKKTKKKQETYLVDYDLPKNNSCRGQFYRKLKTTNFEGKSTRSVVISKDLKKATAIYRKAAACGTANIYKVKKKKI